MDQPTIPSTMAPSTSHFIFGIICYLIFHKYEPRSPWIWAALLLVPPLLSQFLVANIGSYFVAYTTHVAVIVTLTLAYRLSPYHPLAKYPGPRIAAMTKLWLGFISRTGKQHLYSQELHMRYGDIVRTGPNELSFIDSKYVSLMMGSSGMPKGPMWEGRFREQKIKGLVGLRDPIEHTDRRKKWQRGFNSQALQDYGTIIEKRSTQLMDCLSKHADQPVDLEDWISRFAFDFMMDMTFDGGSEMLRDGDPQGVREKLEKAQPHTLFTAHLPWFAEFVVRLPWLRKDIKAFRDLAVNRGIERKKFGAMNKDLMYHLLDEAGMEKVPPPMPGVLSDAVVAFLGGSDTTVTALTCLFYLLMKHPEQYQRLREEVDSTTGHTFDNSVNANMPYLNAAIHEAMRLFPPVPSGSQRAPAIGSGGCMLGEHFIPEETAVSLHTYTMHRDPRNFSQPDSFLPERWLPTSSPYAIRHNDKTPGGFNHNPIAFIPFSHGPMICIGKQLALQEMRVVVRLMVEKFEMHFADGYDPDDWERDMKDYAVVIKGNLPAMLKARGKD